MSLSLSASASRLSAPITFTRDTITVSVLFRGKWGKVTLVWAKYWERDGNHITHYTPSHVSLSHRKYFSCVINNNSTLFGIKWTICFCARWEIGVGNDLGVHFLILGIKIASSTDGLGSPLCFILWSKGEIKCIDLKTSKLNHGEIQISKIRTATKRSALFDPLTELCRYVSIPSLDRDKAKRFYLGPKFEFVVEGTLDLEFGLRLVDVYFHTVFDIMV